MENPSKTATQLRRKFYVAFPVPHYAGFSTHAPGRQPHTYEHHPHHFIADRFWVYHFSFFPFSESLGKFKKDPAEAASKIGLAIIGLVMLIIGIFYHKYFMPQVRKERERLNKEGFIVSHDPFPVSMTLIIAVLLLLLGTYVIFKMATTYY